MVRNDNASDANADSAMKISDEPSFVNHFTNSRNNKNS